MTKKQYAACFRDPRWQRKRLSVMERDGFKCRLCGNERETLNVHHLRYSGGKKPWDYEDRFLVTLCETCHEKVENERAEIAVMLANRNAFNLYSAIRKFACRHGKEFVLPATSVVESIGHALDRKDSKQVESVTDSCHGIEPDPSSRIVTPEEGRNFFAAIREKLAARGELK